MKLRKILTFVLCLVLLSVSFNCVPASAGKTASQLQQQIEKLEKEEKELEKQLQSLKSDKKKQQELKASCSVHMQRQDSLSTVSYSLRRTSADAHSRKDKYTIHSHILFSGIFMSEGGYAG